jgi:hypothetical protein
LALLGAHPILHVSKIRVEENYENLELVLTKIGYTAHEWMICGDLKALCMLLGQQAGYIKYPCFMCEWDSRPRTSLEPGSKNILRKILSILRKYCCHPFILN